MSSVVAQQVKRDPDLTNRLSSDWQHVVILERYARAAGATRWYFARSELEINEVIGQLQGGSCVSFYFDDHFRVDRDDEVFRQEMFEGVSQEREIVVGYPKEGQILVDVELVSGPGELSEVLMHHVEGSVAFWGPWPDRERTSNTTTIDLLDEDGILRRHAH
jgi:hypothetical protein